MHPHQFHIDHNPGRGGGGSAIYGLPNFAQLLLGITGIPREIEDNGYVNFWG